MRNLLILCMVIAGLFWGGMAYATVAVAGFNGGTVFYALVGVLFEFGLGVAVWHTRGHAPATRSIPQTPPPRPAAPVAAGQHEDA